MQTYFQGQINKKEYKKAFELHFYQRRWLKWICGLFLGIILFSVVIAISRDPSSLQYFFPSIIFPLVFLTFPWWTIYLQAASYNQKGNIYRTPINGLIDDTGISINGQVVKSNFLWKAFTHYKTTDEMVLLYQGKSCFNIFTASLFSNKDEWEKFQNELKVRINKNSK